MVSFITALLILVSGTQDDDFPFGPLDQKAHAVFQIGRVGFIPDMPVSLKEDDVQIHVSAQTMNLLNVNPNYSFDMEFERFNLTAWYGVTDRFALGINIPVEAMNGGFEDALIYGFHDAFGLSLGSRPKYSHNDLSATIGGKRYQLRPSIGLGDIMLYAQCKIFEMGDLPGWSIGYQLRLPTAASTDLYTSREVGLGLATNIFYKIGDFFFDAGISFARINGDYVLDQQMRPLQASGFFMVEYRLTEWMSIVGQAILQSGPARVSDYARWSFEFDGGFKFMISKNVMFDIGAFENAISFENSVDFGLFSGLTLKY